MCSSDLNLKILLVLLFKGNNNKIPEILSIFNKQKKSLLIQKFIDNHDQIKYQKYKSDGDFTLQYDDDTIFIKFF